MAVVCHGMKCFAMKKTLLHIAKYYHPNECYFFHITNSGLLILLLHVVTDLGAKSI